MRFEIRIRMVQGGGVTRHLVIPGYERALCGLLTLRSPTNLERWAPSCARCAGQMERMEAK